MLKHLVKHGNTFAITVEKSLLASVGLDENAVFQVVAIPGKGIIIQSADDFDKNTFDKSFEKVKSKYKDVFNRLADQ